MSLRAALSAMIALMFIFNQGAAFASQTEGLATSGSGYSLVLLETLGGVQGEAWDINDLGQICGWTELETGVRRASVWNEGQIRELRTLKGATSQAYGINNGGLTVGFAEGEDDSRQPMLWDGEQRIALQTLGGNEGVAYEISDSGDIVGWSETVSGDSHATLWRSGLVIDLGTLGGNRSEAWGINSSGQIVGWSDTIDGESRAVSWEDEQISKLDGEGESKAYAVSEEGLILGWHQFRPVAWSSGELTALPVPSIGLGQARDINRDGTIVGQVDSQEGGFHAALWANSEFIDLGTWLGSESGAVAVNSAGNIVGYAETESSKPVAAVWTLHPEDWPNPVDKQSDRTIAPSSSGSFEWASSERLLINVLEVRFRATPKRTCRFVKSVLERE